MYPGKPRKGGRPGELCWQCRKTMAVWSATWLGVTLMKCVIHRQDSYPDNAGHWRRSVALEVPLARVSARLRREPTITFGKSQPHPRQYQSRPEIDAGIGGVPNGRKHFFAALRSRAFVPDSRASQLPRDVWGSSRPLLGISQESESKRRRLSASKGTREARPSMAVARLGWSSDRPKHLPMRRPSGGAPVVVGDVNDVHMAKGCRMIRDWMTDVFCNLEASK